MLSWTRTLAVLLYAGQLAQAGPDHEAVLRHSAAKGRPLVGLHQALQREAATKQLRYVTRLRSELALTPLQLWRTDFVIRPKDAVSIPLLPSADLSL